MTNDFWRRDDKPVESTEKNKNSAWINWNIGNDINGRWKGNNMSQRIVGSGCAEDFEKTALRYSNVGGCTGFRVVGWKSDDVGGLIVWLDNLMSIYHNSFLKIWCERSKIWMRWWRKNLVFLDTLHDFYHCDFIIFNEILNFKCDAVIKNVMLSLKI